MVENDHIVQHGDGIVTLNDDAPESAVDLSRPEGKIPAVQIKEMLLNVLEEDPMYTRCCQLYLQKEIFEDSFLESLNPYKESGVKEVSALLGIAPTTLYDWIGKLEFHIDVKKRSDEYNISYVGVFQLKMFQAMRGAGERVTSILRFMKGALGMLQEGTNSPEDIDKLKDRLKAVETVLQAVVTYVSITDGQNAQTLLAAPGHAQELAEQVRRERDLAARHTTEELKDLFNEKTSAFERVIEEQGKETKRIQEESQRLMEETKEAYEARISQILETHETQLNEILKEQKKGFFKRLFG